MIDVQDLEQVYLEIPHLRTVIDTDAAMFSNLKWELVDSKDNIIESHPVLDLLDNPNPLQNGKEYLISLRVNELLYGTSFSNKLQGYLSDLPSVMYPIPSKGMEMKPSGKMFSQTDINDIIDGYKFELGESKTNIRD